MMEEFEKDREVEKKLYAHINFFKLVLVSMLCNNQYHTFNLLDGQNKLDKLFKDIEDGNICLQDCIVKELYQDMMGIVYTIHLKTYSKSLSLDKALKEIEHLNKVKIERFRELFEEDSYPADIVLLMNLPRELICKNEIRNSLLSTSNQKTIGERK